MRTFEFTLIIPNVSDSTANAIYGRCPDTSLGMTAGITYVAFDREANSLQEAIRSAVSDLNDLGVQPVRVEMEVAAAIA